MGGRVCCTASMTGEHPSMKILHVLHNSLPLLCGYSIRSGYIVNLQRAMGLETFVVSSGQHPNGEQMREMIDGVEYRRTPPQQGCPSFLREGSSCAISSARLRLSREVRPDLIHAHSPVLVGLPALRVARRLGLRWSTRFAICGRTPRSIGAASVRSHPCIGWPAGSRAMSHGADAVVTICDLLKKELQPRAGRRTMYTSWQTASTPTPFDPRPHEDDRSSSGNSPARK